MLNSLKVSFWALVATVVLYASGSFQGMGIGSVAYANTSNPNLTDVGVLVTERTELDADEILELFAVEQKPLVVPIGIDISVPLMIESAQYYLLIRDSISGQWNRYYFTAEEWNTTLKPYFEATDVSILTAPAGADVDTTAAAQAVLAVGNSVYTGAQVANVILYGSANGPIGSPQSAPTPHVEPVPSISTSIEMDQIGTLGGSFRVNESGASTYTVKMALAEGTAGVVPGLSLGYASGQGNGIAGIGWSLGGLSSISRCRKTLAQDKMTAEISWLSSDAYCLDGQRLVKTSGTYGQVGSTYRSQIDNNSVVTIVAKVGQDPTSFKVQRADGSASYYGLAPFGSGVMSTDSDALLNRVAPSGEGKTLTWAIKKIEDSVGNPIWYEYDTNTNRQLITEIKYAYGANSSVISGYGARVTFEYSSGPRPDLQSSYVGGHLFSNDKRLVKISTSNKYKPTPNSAEVHKTLRTYNLAYMSDSTVAGDFSSRLVSIQECSGTSCLNPTVFNWRVPDSSVATTPIGSSTITGDDRQMMGFQVGDINGDGLNDYAWLEGKVHIDEWTLNADGIDPYLKYAISTGNSYQENSFTSGAAYIPFNRMALTTKAKINMLDYNLDGRMDVAVYDFDQEKWKIFLSTPQVSGAWKLSATPVDINVSDPYVRFVDMDSNGTTDLVYKTLNNLNSNSRVYVRKLKRNSQPVTSATAYSFGDPVPVFFDGGDPTILGRISSYSADFNGDGRSDLFISENGPPAENPYFNNTKISAYVFTGDPDGASLTMEHYANLLTPSPNGPGGRINLQSLRFPDINGDGLSDVFYQTEQWQGNPGPIYTFIRINRGDGSFDFQEIDEPTSNDVPSLRAANVHFVDWNMDGYQDLVWKSSSNAPNTPNDPVYIRYWNPNTREYDDKTPFGSVADSHKVSLSFADVNADGVLDRTIFDMRNGQSKIFNYARQAVTPGPRGIQILGEVSNRAANNIDRITNGLGMTTEIDYEPLSISDHYARLQVGTSTIPPSVGGIECSGELADSHFCINPQTTIVDADEFYRKLNSDWILPAGTQTIGKIAPVLEFNGPVYVTTDVSSDTPIATDLNAKSSISYFYERANIQAAGSGFLGFRKLTTVDNQKGVESSTIYRQDWPFIGYPAASVVRTQAGHVLSSSITDWGLQGYNSGWSSTAKTSGTVALGQLRPVNKGSVQKSFDLVNNGLQAGALLNTVTSTSTYDSESNPLEIVVANKNATGQVIKSVKTTNTYFSTAPLPLREARLKTVEVETTRAGFAQKKTRNSEFTYYQSGSKRGLLETEAVEPGTSVAVTTTHSYDGFGNNIKSKLDSENKTRCDVVTADYDSRGRYVERTYNCLGKLTAENLGRDKSGATTIARGHIDSGKSVTTLRAFSASGKEYFSRSATGGFSLSGMSANVAQCPAGASYTSTSRGAGGGESKTCFDKIGREIRTLNRGFDGQWDAQDTQYDQLSRVHRKSEPYDLSTGPQYWTTNTYDLHDRVVHTIAPDNSTAAINYSGYLATTTNDLGHNQIQEKNVLGEVVRVQDHLGAQTFYKHDHFGNLVEMTDNGDNTTFMVYDVLGRKESMDDPDKGAWTYEYTAFGELKKQVDAKGQVSEMNYDGLGRMTSRFDKVPIPNSTNMATTGMSVWVYSNSSAGSGLLMQSQDMITGFMMSYQYDEFGRTIGSTTRIDGEQYYAKATFDQYGRAFQSFDAAGDGSFDDHGTVMAYNNYGYLKSVADANFVGGTSRKVYQEVLAMNARGQVTSEIVGDEITTNREYFTDTGRLETIVSNSSAGQVQDLRYQWDTVGNLTYRHEYSGAKTLEESFQYDDVNRLIRQTVAGEAPTIVTYDDSAGKRLGNITSKTGVGSYQYGAGTAGPHAVTKAGNVDFSYDLNGNNISSTDGRAIDYTSFDKPSKITKGGHVTEFSYGTSRARFKRIDRSAGGVTTTRYVGNVEIIERPDGTLEKKRYLGGVVVQTIYYGDNDIEDYRTDAYTLKDHLGSIDVIVDADGAIGQEMSFDAWGQRRNATNWNALSASQLITFDHDTTTRGFTGHEMLDEVGIVHMNGRIYDPRIARFLSADPVIQDPFSTQSLNRYSYLWNNPLNGTDPTGYISVRQGLSIAVAAAIMWANPGAGIALFKSSAVASAAATGAIAGFTSGLIATGSLEAAFKNAAFSAASAAVFASIGQHFRTKYGKQVDGPKMLRAGKDLYLTGPQYTRMVLAHGVAGGVLSELQGGKFGHGFASAAFSKAITHVAFKFDSRAGQIAVTMIAGGTVSEITGGKFANGAATAAIQFTVNALGSEKRRAFTGRASIGAQLFVKGKVGIVKGEGRVDLGTYNFSTARSETVVSQGFGGELTANTEGLIGFDVGLGAHTSRQANLSRSVFPIFHANDVGTRIVESLEGTQFSDTDYNFFGVESNSVSSSIIGSDDNVISLGAGVIIGVEIEINLTVIGENIGGFVYDLVH